MAQDISAYKLIIAGSIVFIAGLFVFSVIFQTALVFEEVRRELQLIEGGQDSPILIILSIIPWALGAFYVSFLGVVIYFLLKGSSRENKPPPIYWR